ncbi:TRAP transporter large permease subunit [Devosia rhizoryzae]|uniref:TRAP transporter large permease protein n=1 Tax=Devosia rhizoryzae TaxID=2774137 RepID=A0ABX7C7D3_9HYPH|nr:TRAP transporter large permease subunit [Devosia rhizoryzae]QQR40026.1 TRAP transporter large permease subunit [Devosia rhizoryzae]
MTLLLFVGSLLSTMAIGVPVAFALLVSGAVLMWQLDMFNAQIIAENVIHGADSYPLLAVPFFLLAGEIMNKGGLSRRLINLALALIGHVHGGLGYVTILAAVLLAALSGSAVADAAMLAALLFPLMTAAGHDPARSAGLIAASSLVAPIIPPSIGFIVFGVAANVSISRLFMAGIAPGIMLALAVTLTWWWLSGRDNVAPQPRRSLAEVLAALRESAFALMMPVIIIAGLKMGVFTPTEAGVVAAVYALVVSLVVYRELSWQVLYDSFAGAARTSAVVMLLVAAAAVSAWLITVANIPQQVVSLLDPLIGNPMLLMAAMMLLVIIVGTALDLTPTILILVPVLMPLVKAAGIDPVYFGIMFMINCAIGLITPPVGVVLNTVAGVGRVSMDRVMAGVWPFMLVQFAFMFLLVLFPDLVTVPAQWFR